MFYRLKAFLCFRISWVMMYFAKRQIEKEVVSIDGLVFSQCRKTTLKSDPCSFCSIKDHICSSSAISRPRSSLRGTNPLPGTWRNEYCIRFLVKYLCEELFDFFEINHSSLSVETVYTANVFCNTYFTLFSF